MSPRQRSGWNRWPNARCAALPDYPRACVSGVGAALRGSIEVLRQDRTNVRAPSMEQNPLVLLAESQPFADLLPRQAFDVAEAHHQPLSIGQLGQRGPQAVPRFE